MSRMSRREFVKAGGMAVAATAASGLRLREEPAPLRVGLIGCGGRGTGAAEDCLRAAPNVRLLAMADVFQERIDSCRNYLAGQNLPGYEVEDRYCFTGLDGYRRLLEAPLDLVLMATPPGFRPLHFEAAIEAGKHVFFEKPAAVDPAGVRRVIAAGEKAARKGLAVVAGTQFRHSGKFQETVRRIHDGQIGEIRAARCYYYTGELWFHERRPADTDMEYQVRNWYYFDWLCGDHIVEQHVHTLDACNWALGALPIRTTGLGGRTVRVGEKYGNIFDHFANDYEYPGGVLLASYCRQWAGAEGQIGATIIGTKGTASPYEGKITGESPWRFEGDSPNPYVQEHKDLIESIRAGKPLNEARQVAESTLTAIMGREAAYSGKAVSWGEIAKSDLDLSPPKYEFGPLAVRPVPVPGRYRTAAEQQGF